ncbi:MAG: response regulator [Proteobacteria bacterium]|nr:response regulator [Pseudomonadota bacterium]
MTKVLIVDDEEITLSIIEAMLAKGGYDVITSKDGREVKNLLDVEQPDILIIDIFMPDVDGIENIKAVRKTHPTLPILVISSNSDFLRMAEIFGANASLKKPIFGSNLLEKINSLITS